MLTANTVPVHDTIVNYPINNITQAQSNLCGSLSLNELSIENAGIEVYPNPANEKVNINCTGKQDLTMQIYNIVGECVLQGKFE